jgi:hypothetical protein
MRRHIFVGAMFLVGSLLGAVSPAAAQIGTASAMHQCGLLTLPGTTPFPGLYSETINDPVFANATPLTPIIVETQHSGVWPQVNPTGDFTCTASAFSFAPGVKAELEFTGSSIPDAIVRAFALVEVGVRFNSTQAGGPATLPFSIIVRDRTDIFLSMFSGVFLNTSARFNMGLDNGQVIGFNHAYGAGGIADPGPCLLNDCAFFTRLDGMATANTDYSYFISVQASLLGIISAPPTPTGLLVNTTVFMDPFISIDPDLEFAPGQKYVDYFEVEISPNVVQLLPEPQPVPILGPAAIAALLTTLLGAAAFRRLRS